MGLELDEEQVEIAGVFAQVGGSPSVLALVALADRDLELRQSLPHLGNRDHASRGIEESAATEVGQHLEHAAHAVGPDGVDDDAGLVANRAGGEAREIDAAAAVVAAVVGAAGRLP